MKTLNSVLDDKNNFDAIRLLAAVGVIFSHAYPALVGSNKTEFFYVLSGGQTTLGDLCVAIFFIISGLLITQSFLRSASLIDYFTNRILRIIPALFVVSLVICIIVGPAVTEVASRDYWTNYLTARYMGNALIYPSAQQLPGVFTHHAYPLVTNASIWTLSYEFTCYIFIAAICLAFRKAWLASIALFLFATATVFYTYISPEIFVRFSSYFFAGSIAYCVRKWVVLDFRVFLLSIVALCAATYFHRALVPAICVFGTYATIYIAYAERLKAQNASRYGDFSYGVYLWAWPIQQLMSPYTPSPELNFIFSLPFVFMIAILSWHFVEKPALSKKKLIAKFLKSKLKKFNI